MNAIDTIVFNWHITERCNYACKYCFAKWDETDTRSKAAEIWNDWELVDKTLAELSKKEVVSKRIGENITKVRVNFAGGEPLLLRGNILADTIIRAKKLGFETSIITNGSLLEAHSGIFNHLDMVGISIDSLDEGACKNIGRCTKGGKYLSIEKLSRLIDEIRRINPEAKLKFNVVVSKFNYNTRIIEQLQAFRPDRIKVLRQLPFKEDKGIADEEFELFLNINNDAIKDNVVTEDKEDITRSYLMIDPLGRFFQNGKENHRDDDYDYSKPIYAIGLEQALSQIKFNKDKFMARYTNITGETHG